MTKGATLKLMQTCAVAALLAVPTAPAALAQNQDAQSGDQTQQPQVAEDQKANGKAQQQAEAGQQQSQQQAEAEGGSQPDVLVATVGDEEIRSSEVMTVIGMLPEPLRAQQPDMLIPIALDQLILRELILEKARSENLGDDPEVQQLAADEAATAQDDAMVQVWLQREMDQRVTDQQVQQTYDRIASGAEEGADVPPLETVRPQIEQQLRQQALGEIRASLHEDAQITFYGPEGEPISEGVNQVQPGTAPAPEGSGGADSQKPG